jgi:hypothetical protein
VHSEVPRVPLGFLLPQPIRYELGVPPGFVLRVQVAARDEEALVAVVATLTVLEARVGHCWLGLLLVVVVVGCCCWLLLLVAVVGVFVCFILLFSPSRSAL